MEVEYMRQIRQKRSPMIMFEMVCAMVIFIILSTAFFSLSRMINRVYSHLEYKNAAIQAAENTFERLKFKKSPLESKDIKNIFQEEFDYAFPYAEIKRIKWDIIEQDSNLQIKVLRKNQQLLSVSIKKGEGDNEENK
jgi:Tfp pilus assembly protein PilV